MHPPQIERQARRAVCEEAGVGVGSLRYSPIASGPHTLMSPW
jgi:hypothetical protein